MAPASAPPHPSDRGRHASRVLASTARWLHIYLSMFAFGTMLLFSITGLTLNHPEWFILGEPQTEDLTGQCPLEFLRPTTASDTVGDAAELAAWFRAAHGVRGTLVDTRSDDLEWMLGWKGPGSTADAVIDRETGRYTLAISRHGLVAAFNDLHKGRDTGPIWSIVIDATAILLTLVAVTGFVLIFFIRRRRTAGLAAAVVGGLLLAAIAASVLG